MCYGFKFSKKSRCDRLKYAARAFLHIGVIIILIIIKRKDQNAFKTIQMSLESSILKLVQETVELE